MKPPVASVGRCRPATTRRGTSSTTDTPRSAPSTSAPRAPARRQVATPLASEAEGAGAAAAAPRMQTAIVANDANAPRGGAFLGSPADDAQLALAPTTSRRAFRLT